MNQYRGIIAGPDFEGFGQEPTIWIIEILVAVFFAANLYVISKEFRLMMKHPPQRRDGLLYWISIRIIFGVGILVVLASCVSTALIVIHSLTS